MLTGKAKTDYQREYMRKRRAVRPTANVRPAVLDLVRPEQAKTMGTSTINTVAILHRLCNERAKQPQGDGIAPKIQHFNPMMVGYEPPR